MPGYVQNEDLKYYSLSEIATATVEEYNILDYRGRIPFSVNVV